MEKRNFILFSLSILDCVCIFIYSVSAVKISLYLFSYIKESRSIITCDRYNEDQVKRVTDKITSIIHKIPDADYLNYPDYLSESVRNSPGSYADHIHCPFQILQSEHDANCVPEQVFQLFTALRQYRPEVPARMILYPDSGHGLLYKGPMYLSIQFRKDNLEWFQLYLGK